MSFKTEMNEKLVKQAEEFEHEYKKFMSCYEFIDLKKVCDEYKQNLISSKIDMINRLEKGILFK